MSQGARRNDPCPCGSGLKYKKCCLSRQQQNDRRQRATVAAKERRNEVFAIAMAWLSRRFDPQLQAAFDEFATAIAEDGRELSRADEDYFLMQATEWALAEGVAEVDGQQIRLRDLFLERGPLPDSDQRRWFERATEEPLRLWRVSRVEAGVGLELEDLLDESADPVWVHERSGSRSLERTSVIAARLGRWNDTWEVTCIYTIPNYEVLRLLEDLETGIEGDSSDPVVARATGKRIRDFWVWLMTRRPELPRFVDTSGDPLELTTLHWQVLDRAELERRLAAESDVVGGMEDGWTRLEEAEAEMSRALYSLNPGTRENRLELFARTRVLADEARAWFEKVAGPSVRYLTREIVDPMSEMVFGGAGDSDQALSFQSFAVEADAGADDLSSAEAKTQFMASFYRRQYEDLADERLPIFGNKTPKETLEEPGGRRKVRLWLEEFERNEARMAADDERRPVSLDFLWQMVGIER